MYGFYMPSIFFHQQLALVPSYVCDQLGLICEIFYQGIFFFASLSAGEKSESAEIITALSKLSW